MTINLSQHAGGGDITVYDPGMMSFTTNGYYGSTGARYVYTSSGSSVTMAVRFNIAAFSAGDGSGYQIPVGVQGPGDDFRCLVSVFPSDHTSVANVADRIRVYVANSAGTPICVLATPAATYIDGNDHVLFFSYSGSAGTAVFRIDGDDADDGTFVDRVLTTGTMDLGASSKITVGGLSGSRYIEGDVSYFGMRDAYLTNYGDFMSGSSPKELDEVTWTEWGAQPLFWNATGFMEDNKGSSGDMTKNGAIDLVSPDAIIIPATLGLPTIGDAVAADIALDKIAWVEGVEIVGTSTGGGPYEVSGGIDGILLLSTPEMGSTGAYKWNDAALVCGDSDNVKQSGISGGGGGYEEDPTGTIYTDGYFTFDAAFDYTTWNFKPIPVGLSRKFSLVMKYDGVAGGTVGAGILFNMIDDDNYCIAIALYNNGTDWRVQITEVIAGVATSTNSKTLATQVDTPSQVTLTCIDSGDMVMASLLVHETDSTAIGDVDASEIAYYDLNRALKTETLAGPRAWSGGTNMKLKSFMVEDI